jgi:hypothetical protein
MTGLDADYGRMILVLAVFAAVGLAALVGGGLWLIWYIVSHLQWAPL